MYIPTKTLPDSLRDALASVGYGRTDIEINVADHFSAPSAFGDGCRASAMVVELATGRREETQGSWGGANPFEAKPIDQGGSCALPPGFAALTSSGFKNLWRLYIHPQNAAPLLPARSELSPRDAWILGCFAGLTSAGRKDEFVRHGRHGGPTPDEISSLVARGLLKSNRAGACQITTEGRNSAGEAGRRQGFVPRHSAAEDMALLVSFADGGF